MTCKFCVAARSTSVMAAALLTTALLAGSPGRPLRHRHEAGKANVDTVIKDTIDSGKTLFVRFIASEG